MKTWLSSVLTLVLIVRRRRHPTPSRAKLRKNTTARAMQGKEVEIPAPSSMLVRIDNTVTVPGVTARGAAYNASR